MRVTDSVFSPAAVSRVVEQLLGDTTEETQNAWLRAVATRTTGSRPDLAPALSAILGEEPVGPNLLADLSIGELAVCYEALLAKLDSGSRRTSGQYFTPDDAADFMASQAASFPPGVWLDPCTGVGNLAWHLALSQDSPDQFVRNNLVLVDQDEVALKSAVALLGAEFLARDDAEGLKLLGSRAVCRDSLSGGPLPPHDFAILNPPYARTDLDPSFETASSRDLFAYFMEKVAKSSKGYIAVTPASYLAAPRYQPLRTVLKRKAAGGSVFVFDNVPDTLFRGYKFGSKNTSRTNFVRAAITVSAPHFDGWSVTPILRWQLRSRKEMFKKAPSMLNPMVEGPNGEWAKLPPGFQETWERLRESPQVLSDLLSEKETPNRLDVALTPRYFISASARPLDRVSKATLYFESAEERDRAALVLNSSIPYLWWRVLDGGVGLPKRVLLSVPIPQVPPGGAELVSQLHGEESDNIVVKRNAGRRNENLKRPLGTVRALDELFLPEVVHLLPQVYSNNMFPLGVHAGEEAERDPRSAA